MWALARGPGGLWAEHMGGTQQLHRLLPPGSGQVGQVPLPCPRRCLLGGVLRGHSVDCPHSALRSRGHAGGEVRLSVSAAGAEARALCAAWGCEAQGAAQVEAGHGGRESREREALRGPHLPHGQQLECRASPPCTAAGVPWSRWPGLLRSSALEPGARLLRATHHTHHGGSPAGEGAAGLRCAFVGLVMGCPAKGGAWAAVDLRALGLLQASASQCPSHQAQMFPALSSPHRAGRVAGRCGSHVTLPCPRRADVTSRAM